MKNPGRALVSCNTYARQGLYVEQRAVSTTDVGFSTTWRQLSATVLNLKHVNTTAAADAAGEMN